MSRCFFSIILVPNGTNILYAQANLTCQQALNSAEYFQESDELLTVLHYINFALQRCDANQQESLLAQREAVRSELYPDGYIILERDASFVSNGASIAGTFFFPDTEGPFPALVVVHGSGRMTRTDFMGPAERLVPLGYAVLVMTNAVSVNQKVSIKVSELITVNAF